MERSKRKYVRTTERRCTGRVALADGSTRQCKQSPVPGGLVCFRHGGSPAHARRKAIERLLMLSEPALYFLREVIMDPSREDSVKMQAVKLTLDRVVPASLNIEASLTHKVPGWEHVISKMFAEPQAIESAGPSLQDLTDAYEQRGYTDPETCRNHAQRVLAREVYSAHELSSADIRMLLDDLRPDQTYAEVIEAEVIPEDRSSGARVSRARSEQPVRVESGSDAPPPGYLDRPRGFY